MLWVGVESPDGKVTLFLFTHAFQLHTELGHGRIGGLLEVSKKVFVSSVLYTSCVMLMIMICNKYLEELTYIRW